MHQVVIQWNDTWQAHARTYARTRARQHIRTWYDLQRFRAILPGAHEVDLRLWVRLRDISRIVSW